MGKLKKILTTAIPIFAIILVVSAFINFTQYEFTAYRPLASCKKQISSTYIDPTGDKYSFEKFQEISPIPIIPNDKELGVDIFWGTVEGNVMNIVNHPSIDNYDDTVTVSITHDEFAKTWKVHSLFFNCHSPNIKLEKEYQELLVQLGFDRNDVENSEIDIERQYSGSLM